MSSTRISKVNSLIQEHISQLLSREVDFKPEIMVTVSKVDTTTDLRYTRVFISIFPEKEAQYALKTIQNELYRLQGMLNKRLNLKILPRLEFKIDTTESQADEIEKILSNLDKE